MRGIILWVGWNIFLAIIPLAAAYIFSFFYSYNSGRNDILFRYLRYATLIIVFIIWFFFLPNTCYLITEWRHFLDTIRYSDVADNKMGANRDLLIWFATQMLFYVAYSGIGMLLFVLSTRPMWRIVQKFKTKRLLMAIPFFFVNALGVYLGLIPRFNSWDIMHRPSVIFLEIIRVIKTPYLLGLVISLAIFLWLIYLFFDIWVDGFNRRRVKSYKESN